MCGIVGAVAMQGATLEALDARARARMLETLRYRGPDGHGEWLSHDARCWLGHTRLAIIDRAGGQQPMASGDSAIHVVFNGEIYNHLELRVELERTGHGFRTRSDTEVLVHGYRQWGAHGLLERLRGMFAFALHDAGSASVVLARDRLGIKPLYWVVADRVVLFASEIKALLAYPRLARQLDGDALAQYLTFRYVPAPLTLFKGVAKLPAGHWSSVRVGAALPVPAVEPRRYWKLSFKRADPVPEFDEAVDRVDALLDDAVRSHLMSEVPLGAQLSGGVDSSLIVAKMEGLRRSSGAGDPVRTFAIGFAEPGYSELAYARAVARRYGTEHHEIVVGFDDFVREVARLCWVHDEPVSEPAAIPTYLLCRFARPQVTVMLTGEGGDELFAGYPKCAAELYASSLDALPAGLRQATLRGAARLLPFSARRPRIALENLAIADPAQRLASWFAGFDALALAALVRPGQLAAASAAERLRDELAACDSDHPLDRMLYCDLGTWLVDDLLVKGDRMSMAASVEARVPFLDHALVEYAASLPPEYKVRGLQTKRLLKRLAERYVPREAIYRRKVGFSVPLTPWFLGPLARFVRETLTCERALSRGYFNPEAVCRIVEDHLSGRVDRGRAIWTLLSLEIWLRLFIDDDGSEAAAARLQETFAPSLGALAEAA